MLLTTVDASQLMIGSEMLLKQSSGVAAVATDNGKLGEFGKLSRGSGGRDT